MARRMTPSPNATTRATTWRAPAAPASATARRTPTRDAVSGATRPSTTSTRASTGHGLRRSGRSRRTVSVAAAWTSCRPGTERADHHDAVAQERVGEDAVEDIDEGPGGDGPRGSREVDPCLAVVEGGPVDPPAGGTLGMTALPARAPIASSVSSPHRRTRADRRAGRAPCRAHPRSRPGPGPRPPNAASGSSAAAAAGAAAGTATSNAGAKRRCCERRDEDGGIPKPRPARNLA